jgi:Uncharacterised nucleotidyltransferase
MLILPTVHPFLKALLTESSADTDQPTVPLSSWKSIVDEATTQRIAPLLLHRLNQPTYLRQIPSHVPADLKQLVIQHAAWNLMLTTELRSILAACEQRKIRCIPIRGPVFATQLYGDCAIRQMDDLDVLVHYEDLSAVKDIFQQLGYIRHEHRDGFHEVFSYSLEFVHPAHGFIVEPHWTLAYPPFVDLAAMQPVWRRIGKQRWMEIDTWTLSHEDLLLHLCLHLHHKGRHAPLLWWYELAAVIRRYGPALDWNTVIEQAQLMQQTDVVADVLTLLTKTFESAIPSSVFSHLEAQSQHAPLPQSSILRSQILAQSSLYGREEFLLLWSIQGFQRKLRYGLALLFPSPHYMIRRYGTSTLVDLTGFYVTRLFRIAAEGFRCTATWIATAIAARHS